MRGGLDTHKPGCACPACANVRREESVRFTLVLPASLKASVDDASAARGMPRNAYVVEALQARVGCSDWLETSRLLDDIGAKIEGLPKNEKLAVIQRRQAEIEARMMPRPAE